MVASQLLSLFRSQSPVTLNLNPGYVRPPERVPATLRTYDPGSKQWSNPYPAVIVYASEQEEAAGLERLRHFLPAWQAGPAFLWIKPNTALLVTIAECAHNARAFRLNLNIAELLLAPSEFDPSAPLGVTCSWNQPMLCVTESMINAPYDYRLLFEEHGAESVRAFCRLLHENGLPRSSLRLFAQLAATAFEKGISPTLHALIVAEASRWRESHNG